VIAPLDFSPATLTVQERVRLHQLERVVEKHIVGFIETGKALAEIRSSRLYREHYSTFEQYVKERWALSRSRADELIRSTLCAESLLSTTGSAESDTPLPQNLPEVVLRPISQLPDNDLQGQVWRLVSLVSPEGRTPTHATAAKVVRLIRETLKGPETRTAPAKPLPERELMFVRPVQRLAKIDTFDVNICLLHVKSPEQAENIAHACSIVVERCRAIQKQLDEKFPHGHYNQTPSTH
jgi:hypothetical protein